MSALADVPTLVEAVTRDERGSGAAPRAERDREPTLDELLSTVWEALGAHRPVTCPVCGDAMTPAYGAGALPVGGRCGGCRSILE